jgi:hypothetical protein
VRSVSISGDIKVTLPYSYFTFPLTNTFFHFEANTLPGKYFLLNQIASDIKPDLSSIMAFVSVFQF